MLPFFSTFLKYSAYIGEKILIVMAIYEALYCFRAVSFGRNPERGQLR